MKKKYLIVLLMTGSLIFLVGWGKKNVELLNDKKLIDLNAAIEKCIPGANSPVDTEESASKSDNTSQENAFPPGEAGVEGTANAGAEGTENSGEAGAEGTEDAEKTGADEAANAGKPKERIIVIAVRDRTITYDAEECEDPDGLRDRIRRDNGARVSFRLVDDFAESHVYKKVLSILGELEVEIGLNYTKE